MGFSILPRNRLCSIIISGFWLGFLGLSPHSFGILFHHPFLVPAKVMGLVSLLFWNPVPSSFPDSFGILFHHHFLFPSRVPGLVSLLFWNPVLFSLPGSGACLPTRLASCSVILSWFWLGFLGLSPHSFGILFHHPFLVPAKVMGLVSLLFWHPGPLSCPASARVPGLVSLPFWHPVPSSCPGS